MRQKTFEMVIYTSIFFFTGCALTHTVLAAFAPEWLITATKHLTTVAAVVMLSMGAYAAYWKLLIRPSVLRILRSGILDDIREDIADRLRLRLVRSTSIKIDQIRKIEIEPGSIAIEDARGSNLAESLNKETLKKLRHDVQDVIGKHLSAWPRHCLRQANIAIEMPNITAHQMIDLTRRARVSPMSLMRFLHPAAL